MCVMIIFMLDIYFQKNLAMFPWQRNTVLRQYGRFHVVATYHENIQPKNLIANKRKGKSKV